jgi:hypothetical protein
MNRERLPQDDQFAGLIFLDYVSDLFTVAAKETFTRSEILIVLNNIKCDPDLFDPDVVVAYEQETEAIQNERQPGV